MTGRLNKVDAGVNTVVLKFVAVNSVLLLEVVVKARLDVVDDGLPAIIGERVQGKASDEEQSQYVYASDRL